MSQQVFYKTAKEVIFLKFFTIYPREYSNPTADVVICNGAQYSFFKLNTLVLILFRVFRVSGSYLYFIFFFFFFFFFKIIK